MNRLRGTPPIVGAPASRISSHNTAGSGFARTDGRSSSDRGYGADWRKARTKALAAFPVCLLCHAAKATEVDHIRPFHGVSDPLRLDPKNLRPVCAPCHRAHTARQSHGARGTGGRSNV